MSDYQKFVFESYEFNSAKKELVLTYGMDGQLVMTEKYVFDFPFAEYDPAVLDRAMQLLFFVAGVSYYKTFVPPEIEVRHGHVDQELATFLSKTYQKGLGEFWYVNGLDPNTPVTFPVKSDRLNPIVPNKRPQGLLVGIGGGKDSLVSVELLRNKVDDMIIWSMDHEQQLAPLVERIDLPHYSVKRQWDPYLIGHKNKGGLNGHVPISAIFACVGTIVCILTGRRDNVVSNESSASEPTLTYQDVAINHQYSKSLEFEQDFQAILARNFGDSLRYYSFLRPLSELRIAEIFAAKGFEKYKDVFSSCNRAFVHDSDHMSWCGTCPKCAFVFLALTPFVPRDKLEALFGSKNLLLDPNLEPTYKQLLGIEGDKPLECVGEIKESRTAMQLAQSEYPELLKYHFDVPANYDFRTHGPSSMPDDILRILVSEV